MADPHHPGVHPEHHARALEDALVDRGVLLPGAVDAAVARFDADGPLNGAVVVARAWTDPAYRARLFEDATLAAAALGFGGGHGERLVALENTASVHNVIVCTLCSCYPTSLLGPPPEWYKSAEYRSRVVRDPRGVLAEFGTVLPAEVEVRVWDSTAEVRYLVVPERPAGAEGLDEEALRQLVTRDALVGVRLLPDVA
ncbi:MAG: nitrile hydratase subunit alpha [Acidimicrobiales bacterium]